MATRKSKVHGSHIFSRIRLHTPTNTHRALIVPYGKVNSGKEDWIFIYVYIIPLSEDVPHMEETITGSSSRLVHAGKG